MEVIVGKKNASHGKSNETVFTPMSPAFRLLTTRFS